MRKRLVSAALAAAMALSMTACTSNPAEKETEAAAPADTEAAEEGEEKEAAADGDLITVGYAQVGAESDWRTANTESFKSTFTEENGYKLIFDDAQQKQENQIKAIRSFIQQLRKTDLRPERQAAGRTSGGSERNRNAGRADACQIAGSDGAANCTHNPRTPDHERRSYGGGRGSSGCRDPRINRKLPQCERGRPAQDRPRFICIRPSRSNR